MVGGGMEVNDSEMGKTTEFVIPEISVEKTLDDCEFFDYLNYIGQWSKGLIPSNAFFTINLNELMASEVQPNVVVDKKKPQGKPEVNKEEFKEDGKYN